MDCDPYGIQLVRYIAGIGVFLIAAGLFLASHWSSSPAPVATAQDHQSPALEIAAHTSPPALPAMPKATAAAPSAPKSQQPSATASAPALDHTITQGMTTALAQPAPVAATIYGGDPVAGRLVFRKCQACHSLEPGKNILGPSLAGIIGRKAGAEPGYYYSPAMKQADIVWDAKTLDAYLTDPQKVVPGNKMPFPGLKTEHDRADVIAFFAAAGSRPRPQQRHRPPRRTTTRSSKSTGAGAAPHAARTTQRRRRLLSRRQVHFALGHCGGTHGLYRRRRLDRG